MVFVFCALFNVFSLYNNFISVSRQVSVETLSPTCIFNLLNISKCHSILGNDVVGAMAPTAPIRSSASKRATNLCICRFFVTEF